MDRYRAVGIDYIPLSADPRSGESAGIVCSNAEGDNRVWTDKANISDAFTVSTVEGRGYRLGLSFRQRQ